MVQMRLLVALPEAKLVCDVLPGKLVQFQVKSRSTVLCFKLTGGVGHAPLVIQASDRDVPAADAARTGARLGAGAGPLSTRTFCTWQQTDGDTSKETVSAFKRST
jgi:hypothetical protein